MALAIVLMALPVSALLSAVLALAIAWPRRRLEPGTRKALAWVTAIGVAHLAPWALALALDVRRGVREDIVCAGGVVVATLGVAAVALVVARHRRSPGVGRALAWLLPHAILLATYLSDLGRDGVGELL